MAEVPQLGLVADITALTSKAAGSAGVLPDERTAVLAAFRGQLQHGRFASVQLLARGETDALAESIGHPVNYLDGPMSWGKVPLSGDHAQSILFLEGTSLWLGPELLDCATAQAESQQIVAIRMQPGSQAVVLPAASAGEIPGAVSRVHDHVKAKKAQRVAGFDFVDNQQVNLAAHGYLGLDYPEGWRYFAHAASVGVGEYKIGPTEENAFWVMNHHHMRRMLGRLDTFCGLAGQRVLEIGASVRNGRPAEVLLDEFDVRSYTGLNISPFQYELSSSRARLIESDIHKVDFDEESFDVIFSIAVWEHIPDPIPVLSRIADWLSPGGFHYGTFLGFNGPKGHHIYGGPLARSVPDWAHLTHTPDQLRSQLESEHPDSAEVDRLLDLIYTNDRINRVPANAFYEGLNGCGLEVLYLDGRNGGKLLRGAKQAAEKVPSATAEELSVQGFEFVLRKSEFSLEVLGGAPQSTGSPTT